MISDNKIEGRNKKPIAYTEESMRNAKFICEDFVDFTKGVRCLFLIHRNKEGGATNNTKTRKIITTDEKEYRDALAELLLEKSKSEIPYRIYASVNSRDFQKAIRKFKYEQLDADYFGEEAKNDFYLDIKNRFLGCLMQPASKAESYFIVDCDTVDNYEALKALSDKEIVKMYRTKNGWHIITKPFNPELFNVPGCELNKDGLILLSY